MAPLTAAPPPRPVACTLAPWHHPHIEQGPPKRRVRGSCQQHGASDDEESEVFQSLETTPLDFATPPGSPATTASANTSPECYALNADSDDDASSDNDGLEAMFNFEHGWLDDGIEEDAECCQDLEEMYSFDLGKIADAFKRGAGLHELSEIIEEAMVASLQRRLSGETGDESASISLFGKLDPEEDTWQPMAADLDKRMTPPTSPLVGRVEGFQSATTKPASPSLAAVAIAQLQGAAQAGDVARTRQARCSVAQHPQLAQAVSAATARYRRSLAAAAALGAGQDGAEDPEAGAKKQQAAAKASKRRVTILKAAEVLEAAGVGVGEASAQRPSEPRQAATGAGVPANEVDEQLRLVRKAMDRARRRHRQSVAEAVWQAAHPAAREEWDRDVVIGDQRLTQERIKHIVSAAYARHLERWRRGGAARGQFSAGAPLALMHTRAQGTRVHCGPLKPQEPPRQGRRRPPSGRLGNA